MQLGTSIEVVLLHSNTIVHVQPMPVQEIEAVAKKAADAMGLVVADIEKENEALSKIKNEHKQIYGEIIAAQEKLDKLKHDIAEKEAHAAKVRIARRCMLGIARFQTITKNIHACTPQVNSIMATLAAAVLKKDNE